MIQFTSKQRTDYLMHGDDYRNGFEDGLCAGCEPEVKEDVRALIDMRRGGIITAQQFIVDVEDQLNNK